ncbi:aspartate dehydrogenase domain-containing protein [Ketogulonicigenium vulgare]|uniref:aspartate dehydrogenase domain-containing protein n=1 Tax=Ketogulonicigenium vulgare TaxID=92945 RepID=UPI0023590C5B|nr:aspartate dehydrogenase domain-containing protein [Ketogulonicigenium vulgare]
MIRVTVLGLGAAGLPVALALQAGQVPGMMLHSVAASTIGRAQAKLPDVSAHLAQDIDAMGDLVVECLPPAAFAAVVGPIVQSGRDVLVASVGGLLNAPEVAAYAGQGRIFLPSGALGGLDGVRAIAASGNAQMRLTSEKPVAGFEQSAYLTAKGIVLADMTTRTCLFSGPAREGVRLFPKNVNVVAALSLAGIGADDTQLELWADPDATTNQHKVTAIGPAAHFEALTINLPDPQNPRTSALTGFSLIAALRNIAAPIRFA